MIHDSTRDRELRDKDFLPPPFRYALTDDIYMQHTMDFGLIISIFIHVRFIVKKLNLIEISLGQISTKQQKGLMMMISSPHIFK